MDTLIVSLKSLKVLFTDLDEFEEILPIVKASGCHMFIQQLKQNNLWEQVLNSMTTHHKPLTLFCPQDMAIENMILSSDVLMHHLTKKFGRNGRIFKSFMDGSKMMMQASQPESPEQKVRSYVS